jgi:hypothetical protein
VQLDRGRRKLLIEDTVESDGTHDHRLAFHLGPTIGCIVKTESASLEWRVDDQTWRAEMSLPSQLEWRLYRASQDPILGWYSPRFGQLAPTFSLVGYGRPASRTTLRTCLSFSEVGS